MKGKVRIIALTVAAIMMLCAMPLNAFAEETEQQTEIMEEITEEISSQEISSDTEETSGTPHIDGEEQTVTSQAVSDSPEETLSAEETVTVIFENIEEEIIGSVNIVDPSANPIFSPIDMSISQAIAGGTEPTVGIMGKVTDSVLPNGVYALHNLGNFGLWMDTQYNSSDPGYHIQQYAFGTTPPTDTFSRSGLFKISQQGNTGRYVIRLMLNNKLSFGVQNGEIITKEIPTIDADVAAADTFTITYSSGGYIIKPYNSSYAISARNTTASGSSGAPDSYLYTATPAAAGNQAKWQMYQYTGEHRSSTVLAYPSSWAGVGIPVGDSGTVTSKTWSTRIGANTPYMRAVENSTQMVSTIWSFMDNRMTLTAKSPGEASIYSMILYGTSEPAAHTGLMYVDVLAQEGTHVIKNVATDRCIDIEGPSRAEGAIIQQWTHSSTANQMKWIVEHVTDGYIRLKSVYSGLYVGVDSANTSLVKQYSTQNDYTLWKMEHTASGNIKLVCKAVTGGYVLAPPSATSGNGADLTMTAYTNDTDYRDEWEIFEDVTFGDLLLTVGDTVYPDIQTDCANNLIDPTDYTYTIESGASHAIIYTSTAMIYANTQGKTHVKATHKELNSSYTFEIDVYEGKIYLELYACNSEIPGHVWINIINNTTNTFDVGHYENLAPGESVSVGKFGDLIPSLSDTFCGIWYNREHNIKAASNGDEFTNYISMIEEIYLADVTTISDIIASTYSTYDLATDHCGHFAKNVWNTITDKPISIILPIPASVYDKIVQQYPNDYESNKELICRNRYGYYNGNDYCWFDCIHNNEEE